MRKGDIRKAAIIETAENLFYSKGYEKTSIQDVLDALSLSKGGFYHHFESKLSLLDAICEKRMERYAHECRDAIAKNQYKGIDKLNCALSYSSYLKDSSVDFIAIMLKVCYKEGAVMLRDHMKMASMELLSTIVNEAVEEGVAGNIFFARYTDELGGIILSLTSSLTDEISLLSVRENDIRERMAKIQHKIEAYQYTLETLLNAPHGSIRIFDTDINVTVSATLMLIERNETEVAYVS